LNTTVLSGSDGTFSIGGDYTCQNANDQVYIVATGGNPGLAPGTENPALVMMAALGPCSTVSQSGYYHINELTTVAAAWALAPFMSSATNVASTLTNYAAGLTSTPGLTNAFLNAKLLVDPNTGSVATIASNLTVEKGKLNALADAMAPCVNSDGGEGCAALFAAATEPGGVAPTDTLGAVLNIVKNPGNHIPDVFNCIEPFLPFPTTLTKAPNDWTMSISIVGGGISSPTALAVDGLGNVWVANYVSGVIGFSPQGVPFSPTPYSAGSEAYGLTVDTSNNIWVTNEEQPPNGNYHGSVSKLFGVASGGTLGSIALAAVNEPDTDFPESIAADTNGNILVGNFGDGTASIFSGSGSVVSGGLGSGYLQAPSAITADANHGLWVANSSGGTITHINASGNILSNPSCCHDADGIALDPGGNVWVSNYLNSSLSEVGSNGTPLLENLTGGGISSPSQLTVDPAQNIWVANFHGASFSEFAGNGGTLSPGTAISPATGFGTDAVVPSSGGNIASLLLPFGIRTDPSGNVWVTAYGSDDLVMFLGLAAPTSTPLFAIPTAP
jgi:streptogramin lyase